MAWTQPAASQAAIQNYGYVLYVDGTRTPITSASCTGTAPTFECTTALPVLPAGRHLLQLAAVDRTTGAEGPASEQIVVGAAAANQISGAASSFTAVSPSAAAAPFVTCTQSSACFDAQPFTSAVGRVSRIVALPDERVIALYEAGIIRILPGGELTQPVVDREGAADRIVDIAVDPDFPTNHFVYLATMRSISATQAQVTVVRMREVGDQLGEAAAIGVPFPVAREGMAILAVGPDRRIYIAISAAGAAESRDVYAGYILRIRPDGAAAGQERTHSPVLSRGASRPASLNWFDPQHLIVASAAAGAAAPLGVIPLATVEGNWPAAVTPVRGIPAQGTFPIRQVVAGATMVNAGTKRQLFILASDPPILYVARMAATSIPTIQSWEAIALDDVTPLAIASGVKGDLLLAAIPRGRSDTQLYRLRSR